MPTVFVQSKKDCINTVGIPRGKGAQYEPLSENRVLARIAFMLVTF